MTPAGTEELLGEPDRLYAWASVTKLASAIAVLAAVEAGLLALDEPAGPPGSTVRHLLAHASGLAVNVRSPVARPGSRRIYSSAGFDVLGELVAEAAGRPFPAYFASVWGFPLDGSPARGVVASLECLVTVASELLSPVRVSAELLAEAATVQFPGLSGVLPGFGSFEPNDWGLGLELRDAKEPHWTGSLNSASSFGHFGASGTFLWIDPDAALALACLTDCEFGPWAKDAWPLVSDALLRSPPPRAPGSWPFTG